MSSLAAGLDLMADLETPLSLEPKQRVLVPTGLALELPPGYEAQIRPRSGLAWKHGVTVLNSPGTIDADYRGEIKILLVNLGDQTFVLQPGDRVAQMIIAPVLQVQVVESEVNDTLRGAAGFGSTGLSSDLIK
jgi:dUTP pyrophosphatase